MRNLMREELEAYFLEETEEEEEIVETSTMAAGDVQGSGGGLGKKTEIYDIWNQKSLEENNMNKFKITKGRLRQIIFEEVQRAKRLDEAWNPKAEEDEAEQEGGEAKAAAALAGGAQGAEAFYEADEGGEGIHDIFNLPEDEPAPESSGNSKEDALRDIVRTKTAGKVEGADIDLYSASAVLKVLDSLSDDAKNRFLKLDVSQMAEMAMRLMKEDVAGEDRPESEEHYRGAAEDDWSQIRKLEKDAEYDRRRREKLREDEKADKDYDGDGEVESSEEEWKGSRDKAIKKAVTETLEGILSEEPVEEGAEERVAKFNKGPSTEERREKLKKIAAANKAKKEKDKK